MLILEPNIVIMTNIKRKKNYVKLCGISNFSKKLVCLIFHEKFSFVTNSFTKGFRKDTVDQMKFCISISLLFPFPQMM